MSGFLGGAVGPERVIIQHLRPKGGQHLRHGAGNGTKAHQTNGAVAQFPDAARGDAVLLLLVLPALGYQCIIQLDLPQAAQHEHDRVLGHCTRIGAAAVAHWDARLPGCFQIKQIIPNAHAMNQLQFWQRCDQLRIQTVVRLCDQHLRIRAGRCDLRIGTAFQYAVEWGILVKSPVPADSPKKSTQERTIWTVEEMRAALDSMEDPILHLAVHLTLVGALREGEIVGLTPEDLDFDAADGIGTFRINKSMQRVRKEALNQVDDGCIIKIFPDKLERSTTSLILKSTKTASSCRTIFMTSALKEELKKWLNQLAADEMKDPARYHDSGMLFRLPNGLAVEPVLIRKKFLKWQDAHPEFPRIVFHGLRHSSATYQLMISGGDVKAVQGTTGHATADMLVNTYAHIQQSSRVELGRKFEEGFYAKQESPSPQAVPAAGEPTISMTALLELLKDADPEVKAQLRLALLT